MHDLTLTETV